MRLAGHHGLAKAHEHDVKPARLQRDGPAGGNMDAAFALPHLHDAVVMDHLVNFHPLGKPGRCRNKPVIGMAFIGDADIATGDGHPRRGGADLNGSDFEHISQRGAGDCHQQRANGEEQSCHDFGVFPYSVREEARVTGTSERPSMLATPSWRMTSCSSSIKTVAACSPPRFPRAATA